MTGQGGPFSVPCVGRTLLHPYHIYAASPLPLLKVPNWRRRVGGCCLEFFAMPFVMVVGVDRSLSIFFPGF